MDTFQKWITEKYIEWRGKTRRNISDFAVYLGVSQPTVSAWINGTRGAPTSKRIINILINKFGVEAYDVLGIRHPDSNNPLVALQSMGFPLDTAGELTIILKDVLDVSLSKINEKGISKDSPEAFEIINEELFKSAFRFTRK